jgi:hypothetical protein
VNQERPLKVLSGTTGFIPLGSCKMECDIELLLHKNLFILSLFPARYWLIIQPGRDVSCHGIKIDFMCADPPALPTTSCTQFHKSSGCLQQSIGAHNWLHG